MRQSASDFLASPHKRITLMGMSGVGKTRLANILRAAGWFHYSVDYRIGTRYLDESILDNIKRQAMSVPFLRDLLLSDSIYISNNITFDNLQPLSTWLGKLGDPALGGLTLNEFKRRQALHLQAETAAVEDVADFIEKAIDIYGYSHFLNDVSGSLCELDDPRILQQLADQTLIIYLQADADDEQHLIRQAAAHPKPLYYRESFLDEQLASYMQEHEIDYVALVKPDDFVRWVFPKLFYSRIPRYEAIADEHGYRVAARDALAVNSEAAFLDLIGEALDG